MSESVSFDIASGAGVEINGIKFVPLGPREIGELEAFLKYRIVADAARTISETPLTESDKELIMREAFSSRARCSSVSADGLQLINSMEASMKMLAMSAARHDPDVTVDDIAEAFGDWREIDKAAAELIRLSGIEPSGNGDPKKKNPSTSESSTGS